MQIRRVAPHRKKSLLPLLPAATHFHIRWSIFRVRRLQNFGGVDEMGVEKGQAVSVYLDNH